MDCKKCTNQKTCGMPWKNRMPYAAACSGFSEVPETANLTEVCSYCDKPDTHQVKGPFYAFQCWEVKDEREPGTINTIKKTICKQCYERVVAAFGGIYIKINLALFDIILRHPAGRHMYIENPPEKPDTAIIHIDKETAAEYSIEDHPVHGTETPETKTARLTAICKRDICPICPVGEYGCGEQCAECEFYQITREPDHA